jgi:hypothetical protein
MIDPNTKPHVEVYSQHPICFHALLGHYGVQTLEGQSGTGLMAAKLSEGQVQLTKVPLYRLP